MSTGDELKITTITEGEKVVYFFLIDNCRELEDFNKNIKINMFYDGYYYLFYKNEQKLCM